MMKRLVFLKLGGSVITDKDHSNTANKRMIDTIAQEIAAAQEKDHDLSILLGHGSGSFGHHAAQKYGTRDGVATSEQWQGFVEVGARARELNQIVIERLIQAGVKALSVSPCSNILTEDHKIVTWDTSVLVQSLQQKLVPVIYGDVILDRKLGGVILSTEELFTWLALRLHPGKILLSGLERGVWKDFPNRSQLLAEINPQDFPAMQSGLLSSVSTDVTGGMRSKVGTMISLVQQLPALEIQIFSAVQLGNIYSTLLGAHQGTLIRNPKG